LHRVAGVTPARVERPMRRPAQEPLILARMGVVTARAVRRAQVDSEVGRRELLLRRLVTALAELGDRLRGEAAVAGRMRPVARETVFRRGTVDLVRGHPLLELLVALEARLGSGSELQRGERGPMGAVAGGALARGEGRVHR